MLKGRVAVVPTQGWHTLFEDRYGPGAVERLIAEIRRPCRTFAEIGRQFGVSRERVRQWQALLLPDAPRGHERQRLCRRHQQKQRLLADPLFGSFYRHLRANLEAERIGLIGARDGYRTRSLRLDGRMIVLRAARSAPAREVSTPAYRLPRFRGAADFVYYRLNPDEYLFVPKQQIAAGSALFLDRPESDLYAFKNTFGALRTAAESDLLK